MARILLWVLIQPEKLRTRTIHTQATDPAAEAIGRKPSSRLSARRHKAETSCNLLSVQLADRNGEDQIECFVIGQGQAVIVDPQELTVASSASRLSPSTKA